MIIRSCIITFLKMYKETVTLRNLVCSTRKNQTFISDYSCQIALYNSIFSLWAIITSREK